MIIIVQIQGTENKAENKHDLDERMKEAVRRTAVVDKRDRGTTDPAQPTSR